MIIGKATIVVLAAASVCSSSAFTAAPSIRPVSTTLGLGKLAVAAASSNRIYDSKKAAAEEMKAPDPSSGVDAEIKKAMGKKQATDCRYPPHEPCEEKGFCRVDGQRCSIRFCKSGLQ